MKRVVITGMGIWSCLGVTLDEVRDSLYSGKSGIVLDQARKEMGFRSGLTSYVPLPDLKKELPRAQRVYMPEPALYAYCATRDALAQARIDQEYLDAHEVGLLYGNDSTAKAVYDSIAKIREKNDTMLCGSGAIFQSMNSTVTMNLGVISTSRVSTSPFPALAPAVPTLSAWELCSFRTVCRIWWSVAVPRR